MNGSFPIPASSGADFVGIRVLDHVVVGDGIYVSFLERGLLGEAK
jgi:DNA repair protein RadC